MLSLNRGLVTGAVVATGLWLMACGAPQDRATGAAAGSAPASGGPVSAPASGEITVFAAASLTDVFSEIRERFRAANPGATVQLSFGASSQLFTQIDQGAKADVFASADHAQMDRAKRAGLIAGEESVFAMNRLIIVTPVGNPGHLRGPVDLAQPRLRLITSQPDVPVGSYTQAMFDRMSQRPEFGADFRERVNANIVSREANVRQIVAKVQLGEADAAVVYRSDITPQAAAMLATVDIPDELNPAATYPIAVVRTGRNPGGAAAFIAFVLSPQGQEILAKWGFVPVRS